MFKSIYLLIKSLIKVCSVFLLVGLNLAFAQLDEGINLEDLVEESLEVNPDLSSKKQIENSGSVKRKHAFFDGKTKIMNPFSLRDPFKKPMKKLDKKPDFAKGAFRNGVFTNIPGIGDVALSKIKIIGVLVGKERRAMARVQGNPSTVILKEGMLLGKDAAELKAILPGGIVLVEKITNVYGEPEYLETVIPISEE